MKVSGSVFLSSDWVAAGSTKVSRLPSLLQHKQMDFSASPQISFSPSSSLVSLLVLTRFTPEYQYHWSLKCQSEGKDHLPGSGVYTSSTLCI